MEQREITLLANTLGLDFHYPMQKIIAILDNKNNVQKRLFNLGRRNLKEVFVNPKNFFKDKESFFPLLYPPEGKKDQDPKIGFACGGGGLDGYLYSLGAILAINKSLQKGRLQDCHAFSGISSGSIISMVLAKNMPIEENIRALYGCSNIYRPFSARLLYDFAGMDFFKRMMSYGLRKNRT